MTILNIFPPDLLPGDLWLGETGTSDFRVHNVVETVTRSVLPYGDGRTREPKPLRHFRTEGLFTARSDQDGRVLRSYVTTFVLQEDMPMEVERG